MVEKKNEINVREVQHLKTKERKEGLNPGLGGRGEGRRVGGS